MKTDLLRRLTAVGCIAFTLAFWTVVGTGILQLTTVQASAPEPQTFGHALADARIEGFRAGFQEASEQACHPPVLGAPVAAR